MSARVACALCPWEITGDDLKKLIPEQLKHRATHNVTHHPEVAKQSRNAKRNARPCIVCGESFLSFSKDAKICSPECRDERERRLAAEKAAKRPVEDASPVVADPVAV
jgi:predicted nucleic acid-binding Zn ribbon protein